MEKIGVSTIIHYEGIDRIALFTVDIDNVELLHFEEEAVLKDGGLYFLLIKGHEEVKYPLEIAEYERLLQLIKIHNTQYTF